VLFGRQHAAARAARPAVADQRCRSADITPAATAATTAAVVAAAAVTGVGTAATAAATVVSVTVATTAPSSPTTTPPPPDGRQSAVADQQRVEVHRENGQRTGLGVGSGVGRRRTTSSGDSQVNHA